MTSTADTIATCRMSDDHPQTAAPPQVTSAHAHRTSASRCGRNAGNTSSIGSTLRSRECAGRGALHVRRPPGATDRLVPDALVRWCAARVGADKQTDGARGDDKQHRTINLYDREDASGRGRSVVGRRSPVAGRRSPVAGRRSPVAGRRSPVAVVAIVISIAF
ncbi:hypothetical protein EVAR_98317_1 [Eumeta japonica]|uniref:Uncharacterized protein n=1 Tax=Eumeta variegata TaxID=151549 RepID=A0A4C1X9D2_EUMVA|nr:hypothetical protein EVAR_98317_1 [Eumeta japonica]